MADLQVDIVTPRKAVFSGKAGTAVLPGWEGQMGILPGHAALLSELADGTLSVTLKGQTQSFHITGGFVEVRNNHVRVLADKAE